MTAASLFAMVLQDTWLFKGTIAENVAYGRPDASREEIQRCCDEAYCDHFIRTLPKGYMTRLSGRTTSLSLVARSSCSPLPGLCSPTGSC